MDIGEVTEGDIGEAMGATIPIEHEAGEHFSSSLMYRHLTSLQRTGAGILTLM